MTMTRPTTEQITHKGQLLSSVLDRQFNLLDFGAVGDGVTDDMDALIAAVNAVKAAGGGTLYIPVTANGYYLRYGAFANIANVSNFSIVSNGATLKLQGGTASQVGATAVFSTAGASVNNLLISGLRFVPVSTVLRYGNGGLGGATHFDPQVDLGRADPNEQSSFRYGISIGGPSSNIVIDNCFFGPGMFHGIDIKKGVSPTTIENVALTNLVFDGVGSQCILINSVKNLLISNLTSINHGGSRFDWTLYTETDISNLTLSNIVIRNDTYAQEFGTSGMQFLAGIDNACISNVTIENIANNPFTVGGSSNDIAMSSLCFESCGSLGTPALNIRNTRNVTVSSLVMTNCPWCMQIGGANTSIANFVLDTSTRGVTCHSDNGISSSWSNGTLVDCGGDATYAAFTTGSATATRSFRLSNVDFVFASYVPNRGCIDARGLGANVELRNCRMRSEFGTHSGGIAPVFASDNAIIRMAGCSTVGYAGPISNPTVVVNTAVDQLPSREGILAANSSTPSVLDNSLFVTANTSATSYTNFTDGVQGQEIYVRVNDANTTFDFTGTNLKGRNGVDYTATSGDVIFAKRIGSNWYCTVIEA